MTVLPMKTRTDDFSGKNYPQEHNVQLELKFTSPEGKYYKATLDVSPESFLGIISKHCLVKPFPWEEFTSFTPEELAKLPANSKRRGTYKPAPSVNSIIASLISEKVSA